jgi:hypothetical protein
MVHITGTLAHWEALHGGVSYGRDGRLDAIDYVVVDRPRNGKARLREWVGDREWVLEAEALVMAGDLGLKPTTVRDYLWEDGVAIRSG